MLELGSWGHSVLQTPALVYFYYCSVIEIPVFTVNSVDSDHMHILQHLIWVCTVYQLTFLGSTD